MLPRRAGDFPVTCIERIDGHAPYPVGVPRSLQLPSGPLVGPDTVNFASGGALPHAQRVFAARHDAVPRRGELHSLNLS